MIFPTVGRPIASNMYAPTYEYPMSYGFSPVYTGRYDRGYHEPETFVYPPRSRRTQYGWPVQDYYHEQHEPSYSNGRHSAATQNIYPSFVSRGRQRNVRRFDEDKQGHSVRLKIDGLNKEEPLKSCQGCSDTEERTIPVEVDNSTSEEKSSHIELLPHSSDTDSCSNVQVGSENLPSREVDEVNEKLNCISAIYDEVKDFLHRFEAAPSDRRLKELKYCEEMLTRSLLKLDDISTNNIEEVRRRRKELVVFINEALSKLDNTLTSLLEGSDQIGAKPSKEEEPMQDEVFHAGQEEEATKNYPRSDDVASEVVEPMVQNTDSTAPNGHTSEDPLETASSSIVDSEVNSSTDVSNKELLHSCRELPNFEDKEPTDT